MGDVDEFIASLDGDDQTAAHNIAAIVQRVAPDAEQGTSYALAAFRHSGKPLLALGSTKKHLSLHPFSPAVIEAVADQLDGYSWSKGTVRFTGAKPLPDSVVEQLVQLRLNEITGT